jgi:hypothetical protein
VTATDDRQDMRGSIIAGNAALNAMFDDIALALRRTVVVHSARKGDTQVLTAVSRKAILSDLDTALDRYFPKRRGAGSMLETAIVERAAAAALKPVARAVGEIERADPEIGMVARPPKGE